MGILPVLILAAQTLVPPPPPRVAAPPPPPPPLPEVRPAAVCEAYWNAGAVFSGKVIDIAESAPAVMPNGRSLRFPPGRELTVHVDRSWRGDATGQVTVTVGREFSRIDFQVGEQYVFYTARWTTDLRLMPGGRTKPLREAAQDLAYFQRAERPTAGATITGRIMFDSDKHKMPAPGYTVRVANTEQEWTAVSGPDGVFRFAGLAAASYGIRIDRPENLRVRGPANISIPDPRACSEPEFTILSVGTVDLFVLDAAGKPAVRTTLELIDADTLSSPAPKVTTAHTRVDGSVGWGDVPANHRYIIGLNVTRVPDPRRPQPIVFYPGVADIASAHIFEVGLSETVQLETLGLPASPARVNVTGVVVRQDGTPMRVADAILRSAARLSRGRQVGAGVKTNAEGRFTLTGVAGYRYYVEVSLSVSGENPRIYAVSEEFELTAQTPPLRIVRR